MGREDHIFTPSQFCEECGLLQVDHGDKRLSMGQRIARAYDELEGSPNTELLAASIDAAFKPLIDLAERVSINALSELRQPRAELTEMADAILAEVSK